MSRREDHPHKGESSWIFWRWFDIVKRDGSNETYLRRLYVVRTPLFSIMIHWILSEDPDPHEHDHPWPFASLVLRGSYLEQRSGVLRLVPWFNFCRARSSHRIIRVYGRCVTLVVTGRKIRSWGFHTEDGWVRWQTYLGVDQ